jgi:hypothetical protein
MAVLDLVFARARDSAHVTYRTIIAKGFFEIGSGLSRVMM